MARRALIEEPDHQNAGALALAIEPDASQAQALEQALVHRIGGTLRVVHSTEAAFTAFGESLPDVILISPLLAPSEEERIVAHLGTLGVDASHVRLLSIPRLGEGHATGGRRRWFGGPVKPPVNGGCDPVAFADEVAEYLVTASTLRQNSSGAVDPAMPIPTDTLAGLRIEHIEQLLERTQDVLAGPPSSVEQPAASAGQATPTDQPVALANDVPPEPPGQTTSPTLPQPGLAAETSSEPAGIVSGVATSERDDMPTTTAHEPGVDTPADLRLPRFLIPDERVPLPLRALLEEADGCLRMSFLTGAGACAARTLDLLLAEQGLGGTDRSEQIQQLGKKHPSIAEAFLRGLSIVTNNPSGAWDEARVRLVIAILKAIAYEIYVLGPERKERAAYVIELLERFKAAPKS
jgi:hypothetical protein